MRAPASTVPGPKTPVMTFSSIEALRAAAVSPRVSRTSHVPGSHNQNLHSSALARWRLISFLEFAGRLDHAQDVTSFPDYRAL
jgi:hypothetical protein